MSCPTRIVLTTLTSPQKLYHQTLAIRPKLIKLIEKYSQKKDDFTQLNEKFIKARRDYEALLESSMSHPPQPNYHQYAQRPPVPQQGYPGGAPGYVPQGPPSGQHEPSRYYTPAPQVHPPGTLTSTGCVCVRLTCAPDQNPYQAAASTPSNFQQRPTPAPAPFYLQGAEIPAHNSPRPQQPYGSTQGGLPPGPQHFNPQGSQPPSQQQYPPAAPPPQQQYPPRDQQPPRLESSGIQPGPIQTSTPPPQAYAAYSQPPPPAGQRPHSTYGNPQELATSAYDSPIAPHNPGPGDPYAAVPIYSQDDQETASPGAHATPTPSAPAAPSAPPPGPPQGVPTPLAFAAPSQPQYEAYHPPSASSQAPNPNPYDPAAAAAAPSQPAPPPPNVMTPPPAAGPAPYGHHHQGQPPAPYNPYVPPPAEPSAPQDFYRQSAAY